MRIPVHIYVKIKFFVLDDMIIFKKKKRGLFHVLLYLEKLFLLAFKCIDDSLFCNKYNIRRHVP